MAPNKAEHNSSKEVSKEVVRSGVSATGPVDVGGVGTGAKGVRADPQLARTKDVPTTTCKARALPGVFPQPFACSQHC
ncbi:UNVERIFIED_CONTAM: hypothetical protein Sradi_4132800 [Sesamum radiatum]|uniref:Uncharacterized protein n=1 Tax=Sesamum radiatum TaxID=300843 RepID=A0AAW2P540_SESRA